MVKKATNGLNSQPEDHSQKMDPTHNVELTKDELAILLAGLSMLLEGGTFAGKPGEVAEELHSKLGEIAVNLRLN